MIATTAASSHTMLGMRLDYLRPDQFLRQIIEEAKNASRGYCCVSNVHMCVLAHDDEDFRRIVNGARIILPDSTILQRARSLRYGVPAMETMRGAEIMESLCQRAAADGVPVAFVGGSSEDVLNELSSRMLEMYPTLNIAFSYSPPFSPLSEIEDRTVTEALRHSQARLVFVGLGCPKQERWMADHSSKLDAFLIGVGAAFDFNSGQVKRSPEWVHRAGLEWLYRLIKEPRRLWKRYLTTSPRFLWLLAMDRLKSPG